METRGLKREYVLCIPMRIVKGDFNGAVSLNNRKKDGLVSVLAQAR